VIVDVQRCGPSTGIPSKSEQSDLYHAVYGGHGEAPRVVLAPHHVAACYSLSIEAFNIACSYQTPVILLSDQWLGQTIVSLDDEFIKRDYHVEAARPPTRDDAGGYHRYAHTADHVSPMSVAGDEGLTYRTSGLTHDDRGAPAFDAATNEALHHKRSAKLAPLRERDDLVIVAGADESDIGIMSWGSSASFVLETIRELGLDGRVKLCIPQLVHPLPGKVKEFAGSVSRLLIVEMNYSGQFHRYVRSLVDLPRDTRVYCRPGGRPFTRAELAEPIERLVS
jgi:2-oxoglutarate ferredoxin oxidoreductase subunit alpha